MGWISGKKAVLSAIALLLAMIPVSYVAGAAFLTLRDTPVQADAVVVFIGPDNAERFREAQQLIMDGYARVLLIPARGTMWTSRDGKWNKVAPLHLQGKGRTRGTAGQYPGYYENTHIEVLAALKMMADFGLSSAIFVSSPTHMRRIRIITNQVVPDPTRYQIIFRGSRYVPAGNVVSLIHPVKARQVALEYVKIGWFFLYHSIGKK